MSFFAVGRFAHRPPARTQCASLFLLCCLLPLLLPLPRAHADAQGRELRGFWVDGFNPGYKSALEVDTLLERVHAAHCNAVFVQMRKGGDAYYISRYEPWASDDPAHFDALACLIDKAHQMRPPIAVHAWLNTCAVGTGAKHPGVHIAQLHPEWMSMNASGNADDGEVRKIDPGHPDAADWTFRLYLDVVRHYDVDGIHFDFVRYGSRTFGYNPVSVTRFLNSLPPGYKLKLYKRNGVTQYLRLPDGTLSDTVLPAPDDPAWKQWRRDQVTNLVRKIYAHVLLIRPRLVVSAATIAWGNGPRDETEWQRKSAAMNSVFQDWDGWLREGILDLACPMTYFSGRHGLEYERAWSRWIKARQYQRASAVGVGNWQLTPEQTLEQMRIARAPDSAGRRPYGVMLYSYAGTNAGIRPGKPGLRELELQPDFYAMLGQPSAFAKTPPFAADVDLPPMPWKETPERALIKGFVRNAGLLPVDGALVTVQAQGRPRTYARRTDGTGFYAFLNLPPGTYTVHVTAPYHAIFWKAAPQTATIEAGRGETRQFLAQDGRSPEAADIAPQEGIYAVLSRIFTPANAMTPPRPVHLDGLRVVIGTDTFPGNLYVQDRRGFCLRAHLRAAPAVPFQPGDVVTLIGVPGRIDGEPALDQALVALNGIAPIADLAPRPGLQLRPLTAAAPAETRFARMEGRVEQSDAAGFTVEERETKAFVPLAGRKNFGVEDSSLLSAPPRVGSRVAVTGLIRMAPSPISRQPQFRLLPRTAADIVILAPPPQPPLPWRIIAMTLLALALAYWCARRVYLRYKSNRC